MKPGATIGALVALLGCFVDAAADPVVDTARGDRMIAAYSCVAQQTQAFGAWRPEVAYPVKSLL